MILVTVVALAIALGLIGILVPVMPGSLLVAAAITAWALARAEPGAWATSAIAIGLILAGTVVKYLVPGKRLRASGMPARSVVAGAALGVVGFFAVPVVGLPAGFVLGIYLSEWGRLGHERALPATLSALRAIGLGIVIELAFGIAAAVAWAIGVLAT